VETQLGGYQPTQAWIMMLWRQRIAWSERKLAIIAARRTRLSAKLLDVGPSVLILFAEFSLLRRWNLRWLLVGVG
jgi:hypothetical protein